MSNREQCAFIVDDDASVRDALGLLLGLKGYRTVPFASADDFLKAEVPLDGSCIISDVKMHGVTGLELHQKLRDAGVRVSFIFVTAYDTDEARAEARKAGAIAYFRKPVDDQALIDAIDWALSRATEEKT